MAAYFVLMQQVQDIDRYRAEYLPGLGAARSLSGLSVADNPTMYP